MRKLIITVAPTGSLTTREQLPWLPVTPEEIASAAVESYEAGAAVVHVHVRDPETGRPVQDVDLYRRTVELVRRGTGGKMIVCTTTGGGATSGATPEQRLCSLQLEPPPELASLNVSSMNFGSKVFPNPPEVVEAFASAMKERGVKPEIEVYDVGHLVVVEDLVERGLLDPPLRVNFVMGVRGGIPASLENLSFLRDKLRSGGLGGVESTWMVTAIGRHQLPACVAATLMGGDVRVGFEDNVYYRRGEKARSNAQLVERVARIARELDREVATADEAREVLKLKK
ncbi:MAG: 3-keto-5-aminohexanoate cleavage protein [Promethearchaeota archaeon]